MAASLVRDLVEADGEPAPPPPAAPPPPRLREEPSPQPEAPASAPSPPPPPQPEVIEADPPDAPAPPHVSDEPELVAESADPEAADTATAEVQVAEPWDGYRRMKADDIIDRTHASTAEAPAVT